MIGLLDFMAGLLEQPGFANDLKSISVVSEEPSRLVGILRRWRAASGRLIRELQGGSAK